MNADPLVSIAIHTGKKEYYPLLENILKSFLVCNQYSNIELILIESGKNQDVRDWLTKIDFNDFFVNFDGHQTGISRDKKTSIQKTLLFLDYPDDIPWYTCWTSSISKARDIASGEYFICMAEDNQFVIRGNIIGDYVSLLTRLGKETHMISFTTMQLYKYAKENNRFSTIENCGGIKYFPVFNVKWDPAYFCHEDIYTRLGPSALSVKEDPHRTVNYYNERATTLSLFRAYKAIPAVMWFNNSKREEYLGRLHQGSAENPDFILFKIEKKESMEEIYTLHRPISTEDWEPHINGVITK